MNNTKENSTHTGKDTAPLLTIHDLEELALSTFDHKEAREFKPKFIEKIMNKFGWHRNYKVIVLDISTFKPIYNRRPML